MRLAPVLLDYSLAAKACHTKHRFVFTGNSYIKRNGSLVMGAGAAKAVRDAYPGFDQAIGKAITLQYPGYNSQYGLIWPDRTDLKHQGLPLIGCFQVKFHFKDRAKTWLIESSAQKLTRLALEKPEITFHMNYPGIGNGGLSEHYVAPLLTCLPDNVILYK